MKQIVSRIRPFLAVIFLGISVSACQEPGPETDQVDEAADSAVTEVVDISSMAPTVPVVTATVTPREFDELIQVTGTVEAMNDIIVSAEAGGRIQWIKPLGQRVNRGAMIARMDDRVVQSSYDASKSQYDLANDTFGRQQALYQDSIISAIEFQNARANRDLAKAQLAQAEKVLADARPVSPFSGTVQEHLAQAGELVVPGSPIARIVDTRSVKIKAGIPERYAGEIRNGTRARVVIQDDEENAKTGRITFVSDVVDSSNRTFDVEIKLDNRAGAVKPAMVTKVSIQKNTLKDALVVPRNSVVSDELGDAIFKVVEEGDALIARKITIELGPSLGNETVVLNGLSSGDQIIVVGQKKINDGAKVELSLGDR